MFTTHNLLRRDIGGGRGQGSGPQKTLPTVRLLPELIVKVRTLPQVTEKTLQNTLAGFADLGCRLWPPGGIASGGRLSFRSAREAGILSVGLSASWSEEASVLAQV